MNADPLDGGGVADHPDSGALFERSVSIRPALGWYSATVYAIAISASVVASQFALQRSSSLMPLVIGIGAWVACKQFARRHNRALSKAEFRRLVLFSFVCTLPYEALAIPAILESGLDADSLLFLVAFSVILEFVWVYLAYRFIGQRVIAKHVAAV